MRRKIVTLILVSALLASCSEGSGSSESTTPKPVDGTSTGSEGSTAPTISLPPLPEGFDFSKEENYRQAAINVFLRMKNAHSALLLELQKNDYANPEWADRVAAKADALPALYEEFEALNPPDEYVDQDRALTASMKSIVDLSADLLVAIEAMDIDAAWEALEGLQKEGNRLTENAKFDAGAPPSTTAAP